MNPQRVPIQTAAPFRWRGGACRADTSAAALAAGAGRRWRSNRAGVQARIRGRLAEVHVVRANWAIFEEDYWAIHSILTELIKNANAETVLVIDRTGQLISSIGVPPEFDVTSFASLCAADFEANTQLARLIGERDFSTLYHQGADESMYLARVDARTIVTVLFDRRTTLGLVRLRVKRAVDQLGAIMSRLFDKVEYHHEEFAHEVDQDFAVRAEAEIDNLFHD